MSLLILVVDDEPDVEVLFRQRFRRDGRITNALKRGGPDCANSIVSRPARVCCLK